MIVVHLWTDLKYIACALCENENFRNYFVSSVIALPKKTCSFFNAYYNNAGYFKIWRAIIFQQLFFDIGFSLQ